MYGSILQRGAWLSRDLRGRGGYLPHGGTGHIEGRRSRRVTRANAKEVRRLQKQADELQVELSALRAQVAKW